MRKVGVGGSGRQSLSRLSAFISSCSICMIVISNTYGLNHLKTDLQAMYFKAGITDEGVMFVFTDRQITNEKFLFIISDLLASGEVADLYTSRTWIQDQVRSGCRSAGLLDTQENLWKFFISRIRKNLHMSICFSPVGDGTQAAPLAAPSSSCSSIAITGGTLRWLKKTFLRWPLRSRLRIELTFHYRKCLRAAAELVAQIFH